jgi:hypothetical protein
MHPADGAAAGKADLPAARTIARIVHGAAGWSPFRAGCLARSLVLCRLLRVHGLAHDLHIGVATPGGDFAAHAWVEHAGEPLAEPESVGDRYASFDHTLLTKGS